MIYKSIEPTLSADLDMIKALLAVYGLPSSDIDQPMLVNYFVVRGESSLAGVVGLEVIDGRGLLRSLAVHPDIRGVGLGSKLLKHAEEFASTSEILSLTLLTTDAEDFFEKHGYQRVERKTVDTSIQRTKEFLELCPDSAICMRKDIVMSSQH